MHTQLHVSFKQVRHVTQWDYLGSRQVKADHNTPRACQIATHTATSHQPGAKPRSQQTSSSLSSNHHHALARMMSDTKGNIAKEHCPCSLPQSSKIRRTTRLQGNSFPIIFLITIRFKDKRVIFTTSLNPYFPKTTNNWLKHHQPISCIVHHTPNFLTSDAHTLAPGAETFIICTPLSWTLSVY